MINFWAGYKVVLRNYRYSGYKSIRKSGSIIDMDLSISIWIYLYRYVEFLTSRACHDISIRISIFLGWRSFRYDFFPFFSCDQSALRTLISVRPSVCLSVRPSHLFDNVPVIVSSWNFQELLPLRDVMSMPKVVKVRDQRSRSWPHLVISGLWLQFEFTYGDEMMHKAWCC